MTRILCAALLAAVSATALAQTPTPPARVRGTVEKLENNMMTVKTASGPVSIRLADNFTVIGVSRAHIADLGEGKYIGTTTLGERNGALSALEVHIFPESMRGVGEGHYAWDLKPNSKMTNGNVAEVKAVGKDRMLTVKYKDGEQRVAVPANAKIVMFGPAERNELKKGSLTSARVNVGMHGTVPPM